MTYHRARIARSVEKGTAPELSSYHRTRFIVKNKTNTIPGLNKAVRITLLFHFKPPKDLYIRAETYPAGVPNRTNKIIAIVIRAPRFAGDKNP
jgi:hypothetical protein